jgi:hypothetical protein
VLGVQLSSRVKEELLPHEVEWTSAGNFFIEYLSSPTAANKICNLLPKNGSFFPVKVVFFSYPEMVFNT